MKKLLIAAVLVLGCMGAFAQAHTAYFSVLPGYQINATNVDRGFVGSLDGGYYFSDNVGIHFGFAYDWGRYRYPSYWNGYREFELKENFQIMEVGIEIAGDMHGNNQFYGQLNGGYTLGATKNEWVVGGAFGYRYYFNKTVGLNVQATYHYVNEWKVDLWDGRIGVTFRF